MKSIMQDDKYCYRCGRVSGLECHHVFGGSNRKSSSKFGLTVWLCHSCHNEPPDGVHHNAENMVALRMAGQRAFEKTHTHEEFMRIFGKNYLEV